jgi:hypothetical protein
MNDECDYCSAPIDASVNRSGLCASCKLEDVKIVTVFLKAERSTHETAK